MKETELNRIWRSRLIGQSANWRYYARASSFIWIIDRTVARLSVHRVREHYLQMCQKDEPTALFFASSSRYRLQCQWTLIENETSNTINHRCAPASAVSPIAIRGSRNLISTVPAMLFYNPRVETISVQQPRPSLLELCLRIRITISKLVHGSKISFSQPRFWHCFSARENKNKDKNKNSHKSSQR